MRNQRRPERGVPVLLLLAAAALWAGAGPDYKIDRELMTQLTEDSEATAPFYVVFGAKAQVKPAHRINDKTERAKSVVKALQETAEKSQAGVRGVLSARNVEFTAFWVENRIFVHQGNLELAREMAKRPEVVAILPEKVYVLPEPEVTPEEEIQVVGWNIDKVRAPEVWDAYTRGAGIVVANIDTGVRYDHAALQYQYRGYSEEGSVHFGNWKDPSGVCPVDTPCDNNNHGSHTMGSMVGDDGDANQIGVAPGAQWIACKGCQSGSCNRAFLTACAQWILDPYEDGSGAGAPHVVNNSWGGGLTDPWYQSNVEAWRAAGIFPAFANGNSGGPTLCTRSIVPGAYPESFATGATNINDVIASFSSRGPSTFGGIIKPEVSAPGANVRSSLRTSPTAYGNMSGTSMASPHTAGVVALIWSAVPELIGNISGTEEILKATAVPLTTTQVCGGVSGDEIPNNTYGWGRIDGFAAVSLALGSANQPPTVQIMSPPNGSAFECPAEVTFQGMASDPEDGTLSGAIGWIDNETSFATGEMVTRAYTCEQAGSHAILARVSDSRGASDSNSIVITIVDPGVTEAPSDLSAEVDGGVVTLSWRDNSTNEEGFKIERNRKGKGKDWPVVAVTGANETSYSESPGKESWQYRLRAFNKSGDSAPSNVQVAPVR